MEVHQATLSEAPIPPLPSGRRVEIIWLHMGVCKRTQRSKHAGGCLAAEVGRSHNNLDAARVIPAVKHPLPACCTREGSWGISERGSERKDFRGFWVHQRLHALIHLFCLFLHLVQLCQFDHAPKTCRAPRYLPHEIVGSHQIA